MNNIIKFEDSGISLDARVEDGQVWLTYEQTARLFGVESAAIVKHVQNILTDGELTVTTTSKLEVVRTEGNRSVNRDIVHLNQEMVAHIGYRVRSDKGIEFRRWATSRLMDEKAPQLPAPEVNPMVALQMAQTAALQYLERQVNETRLVANDAAQRVTSLEEHQKAKAAEVTAAFALLPPSVEAVPKTDGQRTIEAARGWSIEHGDAFREAFGLLYKEVRYRLRIDLEKRSKGKGAKRRQSDIIDGSGKAPEIYAIACEIFQVRRANT